MQRLSSRNIKVEEETMNTEEIIALMKSVSDYGISELEYREGEVSLHLKNTPTAVLPAVSAPDVQVVPKQLPNAEEEEDDDAWVKSPLIGTFYSAPSETAESFVKVGDQVKKGQVIGIIETMKLMNELASDRDGKIVEIAVSNEQVVEFGQKLFRIQEG